MEKKYLLSLIFFLCQCNFILAETPEFSKDNTEISAEQKANVKEWLLNQPVMFMENKGQVIDYNGNPVPSVLFSAEAPGVNLFITDKGLTYSFIKKRKITRKETGGRKMPGESSVTDWQRIDMDLLGATINIQKATTKNASIIDFNYFRAHVPNGIYGVKQYEKITIRDVYPGIDWVLYNSSGGGFKYDFIVHPGADPSQIALVYSSKQKLNFSDSGNLEIRTSSGQLVEKAPQTFQNETLVESEFVHMKTRPSPKEENSFETAVGFTFDNYDRNEKLIIDPALEWGTFFGSNVLDGVMDIAIDANDNLYAVGYTGGASTFPVINPGNGAYFDGTSSGGGDAFIFRFSNAGVMDWATFYGGSGSEWANAIEIDNTGNVYVVGNSTSNDMPTKTFGGGFIQTTFGGGASPGDLFILRFSPTSALTWATYYGGSSPENANSVALDNNGNVYVTGSTQSTNFPTKVLAGSYNQTIRGGGGVRDEDAFILRFSSVGMLDWATYYGGSGRDEGVSIATDNANNLYVLGKSGVNTIDDFPRKNWAGAYNQAYSGGSAALGDMFMLRFTATGTHTWGTYLGGIKGEWPVSILADGANNIYLTGGTSSADFPTQAWGTAYFDNTLGAGFDQVVVRFSPTGNMDWSTHFGDGVNMGAANGMTIDACENLYIPMKTLPINAAPIVAVACGSFQQSTNNGNSDGFITKFNVLGELVWSTHMGGVEKDTRGSIAVDSKNNIFMGGEWTFYTTSTAGLPLLNPGGGVYYDPTFNGGADDSYLVKFAPIPSQFTQSQINSNCCSGSATVEILCGVPPFNFVWSNGEQTLNTSNPINTISGLCAGDYSVTITDAECNSIPNTAFFTITQTGSCGCTNPPVLTLDTKNDESCSSGNGSATVEVAAGTGTAPFVYTWNTTPVQTGATAIGLSAGTYQVMVTDNLAGCAGTLDVVIGNTNNPPVLSLDSKTDESCSLGNGSATVEVTAGTGTAPFVYTWNTTPIQTGATATGLSAGTYQVIVTDAVANCVDTLDVIIAGSSLTVATQQGTSNCPSCSCKEWVMINSTSGSAPFTYSWTNLPSGLTPGRYQNKLCPGNYDVTITDSAGCSEVVSVSVP